MATFMHRFIEKQRDRRSRTAERGRLNLLDVASGALRSLWNICNQVVRKFEIFFKRKPAFQLRQTKHSQENSKSQYTTILHKNSAEVDIAPAFGEITTACNVGQAKKGHGACLELTLLQRNEHYF